jgi:hypothetical protein
MKKDRSDALVRKHYWLVSGNVIVKIDDEGNSQALPANGMIITDEFHIGLYQLGKAQQALQMSLFQKLGTTMEVADVILVNISPLGCMTVDEWNWRPEGFAVQERAALGSMSAEVVDFSSELEGRG